MFSEDEKAMMEKFYYRYHKGGTARLDEDLNRDWNIQLYRGFDKSDVIAFFSFTYYDGNLTGKVSSANPQFLEALRKNFPGKKDTQFQIRPEVREFELQDKDEVTQVLQLIHKQKPIPEEFMKPIQENLDSVKLKHRPK